MTYQTYSRYNPDRGNQWQDMANVVLAVWLFISPWVLQFGTTGVPAQGAAAGATVNAVGNAAWNAWVLGVIVFLVAFSAVGRLELWQEWINLCLGAWIFAAPWALGFAYRPLPTASWDHWIVGALVFLLSASLIGSKRSRLGLDRPMATPMPGDGGTLREAPPASTVVPPSEVGVQPTAAPLDGRRTTPAGSRASAPRERASR